VKAGPVMHTIPSFGFVVTERDEPGKLDAEHLKKLGVPPGPLFTRVKKGEAITLPCGKIVSFVVLKKYSWSAVYMFPLVFCMYH
jgi:ribonuclease Z